MKTMKRLDPFKGVDPENDPTPENLWLTELMNATTPGEVERIRGRKPITAAAAADGDWTPPLEFGDYPGHPFRGNQWTDGGGSKQSALTADQFAKKLGNQTGPRLFKARDAGPAMVKLMDGRPELKEQMDALLAQPGTKDRLDAYWESNQRGPRPDDYTALATERADNYKVEWDRFGSNELGVTTVAIQQATADEFSAVSSGFNNYRKDALDSETNREATDLTSSEGEIARAYVRAEYDATQSYFADRGLKPDDEVTLLRGTSLTDSDGNELPIPAGFPPRGSDTESKVDTTLNPASSFTFDPKVAAMFADSSAGGWVLRDTVKVSDMLSIPKIGRGVGTEAEVLVKGGTRSLDVKFRPAEF